VAATALPLTEAEAPKKGAELVETDRLVGGPGEQAPEELGVARHPGKLPRTGPMAPF
jgi:hypothetical protein